MREKKMNEFDSIRLSVFIYQKQQGIFMIKFFHYNKQYLNINFIKISKRGKHRNNKSLKKKPTEFLSVNVNR